MILAKIYFRKGKGAYINLSGDEVETLKTSIKEKIEYVVSIEENGTKITLTKSEKSIKP